MINTFKYKTIQIFHKYSLPRWFVLIIDTFSVFVAFFFAYMLRYNLERYSFNEDLAIQHALFVSGVYFLFMLFFKSYSGLIRQTTIKDIFIIVITNTVAFSILVLISLLSIMFHLSGLLDLQLSILFIHYVVVTVLLLFFRVFIKMFYVFVSIPSSNRKNVLIYGAGETGITVKKVIESDPRSGYQVKGFIDDNSSLQGKKLDGYPVYAKNILTKKFILGERISVFIFAIKDITAGRKRDVLESVIGLGLEILDTPSFDNWLNGQLQVKQFKKVQFDDLLGREPITLELGRIEKGLRGKTILVTGAAGSIGSELVRQLTKFECKHLVLIDQAETPSFFLDDELKNRFPDCSYSIIIGDITNEEKMEQVFIQFRPEIVFHAAAYKHVPVMEGQPHEAFRVNVGGTKVMTDLAIKYKTEKFILVSSDKAVNPTNVMGATKKICELLVQAQTRRTDNRTQFVTTRFGNVLGSSGSVLPIFIKQIAEGGPVTITHPDIVRFFMTIPEACQLVLEASFIGKGGEIYIFDMGNPVRILELAEKMIHLSGLEPYEDIEIKFTGLRPGEKLYEELVSDSELQLPTHHPKISIVQADGCNYKIVPLKIDKILASLYNLSEKEIIEEMQEIVPSYTTKYEITL